MVRLKKSQTWPLIILIGIIIYTMLYFLPISVDAMDIKITEPAENTEKKTDMVSFFGTVGIIGGCIALTLAYVSWKKYKAEQRKQAKKDSNS